VKKIMMIALLLVIHFSPTYGQESKASIRVYRLVESGAYPKTKTAIYCNGQLLAQIGNGRIFTARLAPGKYMFRARDKKEPGIEIEVKAEETYYVRGDMDLTRLRLFRKPNFRLTLISHDQAVAEIKELTTTSANDIKDKSTVTAP
jgi:hypothetical protein